MKPVSGYHVASEHTSVLLFFRDAVIIIVAICQPRVPFSPSPFHKRWITIPFNRNGQEWRAPDDNNINRIPSARKSIRKERTFLCSVYAVSRASEFYLVLTKATLACNISVSRCTKKQALLYTDEMKGLKAFIEITHTYINPLALSRTREHLLFHRQACFSPDT